MTDGIAAIETFSSPDGRLDLVFGRAADTAGENVEPGQLTLQAEVDGRVALRPSPLGLAIDGAAPITHPLTVETVDRTSRDRRRTPVHGERSTIVDRYRELALTAVEAVPPERRLRIVVRAYEAGLALRYELPDQPAVGGDAGEAAVTDERTVFRFPAGAEAYAHRGESPYIRTPVGEVGRSTDYDRSERPLTIAYPDGGYGSLTEAGAIAAPRLLFKGDGADGLEPILDAPLRSEAPLRTPWRALVLGASPGALLERNDLVRNLAPPCRLESTDWIAPGSVIREMTLSTEGGRACVDFAADNGLEYVLFDGGWYGDPYDVRSDPTEAGPWPEKVDQASVDPDRLDLPAVIEYAADRGVGVWLYLDKRALERRLDELLPLYRDWGVAGLKFGFVRVGTQGWTEWLHDAVERCGAHELMVNVHDEYRPTGLSRTYPNLLTQEGVRGNEHFPTADHTTTLPFTRFVQGAADHTICYREPDNQTTDGHQLALAVVFYSPAQHPYWYGEPEAFDGLPGTDFFAAVPTTWDETRVLEGAIGEYATVVRRRGAEWFLGSITNDARELRLDADFLDGGPYAATIYRDDRPDAPIRHGESRIAVEERTLRSGDELAVPLVDSGGVGVRFQPG